jgi:sporulation protein YlmC with PRC-barrel domain
LTDVDHLGDEYVVSPWTIAVNRRVQFEEKRKAIPPGELAVRRGARVRATDGRMGRVDEFVIVPESGHITHMILREGHLWGDKEVTIPVSDIAEIEEGVVHLKLNKAQVEALPAIKVKRTWL